MTYILSKKDFLNISEYIYRKSGIYLVEEKDYKTLAKYIDFEISKSNISDFAGYFFKLRFDDEDGDEFQKLINAITVNETYFFREKNQFEILVDKILPTLHKTLPSTKPLRILSLPCSTGEEPYSILLYILENTNLMEQRKIEIIGVDINSNVINRAKATKYIEYSIRTLPRETLTKWFNKKDYEFELNEEIKGSVDFQVANVFDKIKMKSLGKFDIIFSRNMLVYFNDASRKEAATIFYEMLNHDGYIFLGHAENMSHISTLFKTKKIDTTLVSQK